MATHARLVRLKSYDDDDDDDNDVDDDDSDDDASCATLALRSCIITAGCRPTHAISIFFFIFVIIVIFNTGE